MLSGNRKGPNVSRISKISNNLGIIYKNNETVWITGSIFKDWITNVANQIAIKTPRMQILLIMDNA